jgi:hypothetical protein
MWDTHLPHHKDDEPCKAVAYMRKALSHAFTIRNQVTHPLSTPNSIVIDILEGDDILVRLINIYNPPHRNPTQPHLPHSPETPIPHDIILKYLTDHDLDDNTPTIIAGDFNTDAERWSMPDATPSSWAERLCNWINDHRFSILNPLLTPTRKGIKENERDAVLDLVMANEAVCWFGHIGPVKISEAEALGSDHAALLFSVIPSDHPSYLPDPSPAGYQADDEQRQAWSKAFSTNLLSRLTTL